MNIFSYIFNVWNKSLSSISYKLGTQMQKLDRNGVTGDPARIGTLFTCNKILSENLSRMPITIQREDASGIHEMNRHRLTYLLKWQPNSYQNSQVFWSTIEYHRNYYGNAFVRVHKNANAFPTSFEILHPGYLKQYDFVRSRLVYTFMNPTNNRAEDIDAADVLHFRHISEDGIIGLSPLVAIERQRNINERATSTMDHFYENNATSPVTLETDIPTGGIGGPASGLLKETKKDFQENYSGPANAGRWIHLPIGTKAKSLAMQFADAQLIQTLKFTREDISAAHGVPLFMVDGTAEKLDVEQLTTLFKSNTMGPIVAAYIREINCKLLTQRELEGGFSANFDVFSLIGMEYQTKVNAIKEQVVNGLMTPNEGAKKLGNKPIAGDYGNQHFLQAQYIPLENYDQYNPLLKNDPNTKTK